MHLTHICSMRCGRCIIANRVLVGAGLIHAEISCEFIGDGVHTNPNLIKLLMQSKPIGKVGFDQRRFEI